MNAIQKLVEMSKNEKPWLIVGKGRSFEPGFEYFSDYNVLSINESMQMAEGNGNYSVVFNDYPAIKLINFEAATNIFCPLHASRGHLSKVGRIDFWMSCRSLQNMEYPPSFYYFNSNNCDHFEEAYGPPIHAFNSTYESSIWLLAYSHVKDVFTMGIDFDSEYHAAFNRERSPTSFAAMKYYAQVAIDAYQMNVRPLK